MTRLAAILCAAIAVLLASCSTLFQRPKDATALPAPPLQFPVTEKRFGGPLPEPLSTYLTDWQKWQAEAPAYTPNQAVSFALPPAPAQLHFEETHYQQSFRNLLLAMAGKELTDAQRNFLDRLAVIHREQAILSRLYHLLDDAQHGKPEAFPELIETARRLKAIRENNAAWLPWDTAGMVVRDLEDWLALWANGRTFLSLPPVRWKPAISPDGEAPNGEAPAAIPFSALYTEIPVAQPFPASAPDRVWLTVEFPCPIVAEGREAWLIFPAMNRTACIRLNGHPVANPNPGHPWALNLTGRLEGDGTQHLAIELPVKALGRPYFPVCIASAPKGKP